jgi:hypothetical protein
LEFIHQKFDHSSDVGRGPRFGKKFFQKNDLRQKDYWISDSIAVTLSPKDLAEIASHPDVIEISENRVVGIPSLERAQIDSSQIYQSLWNFNAIGLDQIADHDLSGNGVRIGVIDTGLNDAHPDLAGKSVAWAEFDPYGEPIDSQPHETHYSGHGTHVASVLAGNTTGIAPGASLLAALALPGGFGTFEQILAAMQWIIDPDDDPATDDGARIVNMSWGTFGTSPILQQAVDNMIALGVLPVGAIGNLGPWYSISPGNTPQTVGVGALDEFSSAAGFSGGGTVCWNQGCVLKPDITAPGVAIPGIGADGSYQAMSGTSFAAPHVSAAAALLLEYMPELTISQLKGFLLNTAFDLGEYGSDSRYGRGMLDLFSALDFAEAYADRFDTADIVLEAADDSAESTHMSYYTYFSAGLNGFFELGEGHQSEGMDFKALALADVDGDGYSDLIGINGLTHANGGTIDTIEIFRATHAGGFSKSPEAWTVNAATEGDFSGLIGFADVTGDGRSDLVFSDTRAVNSDYYRFTINVSPSNGQGMFEAANEWFSTIHHRYFQVRFALGDIDGDGRADLIREQRYRYFAQPLFYYVELSGGSSFGDPPTPWPNIVKSSFYGPLRLVKAADVTGDGRDDLVLSAEQFDMAVSAPVYVYPAAGRGLLATAQRWATIELGPGGCLETVADVNGDGTADLIVRPQEGSPKLEIWSSDGRGRFTKRAADQLDFGEIAPAGNLRFLGAANVGLGSWQ